MRLNVLDIAVAGCGPGGLATALLLHRLGHRVTLFERFIVPHPVGSGLILQPTGLAILDALGLGQAARHAGARIDRLFGKAVPSGRTVLDVRYSALPGAVSGFGIHRGALFDLLFRAVSRDAISIETGREVVEAPLAAGGRRGLIFADGSRAGPFDLIVDALGTQSSLAGRRPDALPYGALWTTLDWTQGFDEHALEQRYRRASKMVGVLPVGRLPDAGAQKAAFFWSLRGDALPAWRLAGLDAWKADVAALWPATLPLLEQLADPEQLTFARYCHRTLRQPVETGLVHLGDSWHSTSPQLGQGANMALLDGAALAAGIARCGDVTTALAEYASIRSTHIRIYQAMSFLFTPFYQSDSRVLALFRDRIAGPLSHIPPAPRLLASLVAGSIGAPLKRIAATPSDGLPFVRETTKARAP